MALEFAVITIPFIMLFMFVMELSYDLFTQEVLDNALRIAARQLQTDSPPGNQALAGAKNTQDFLNLYFCPAVGGLIACNTNVLVNVQAMPIGSDFHDLPFPQGVVPSSGGALAPPAQFTGAGAYCSVKPGQFVQVSVIYIGPTFLGYLLPNIISLTYNKQTIHATLATIGFSTEHFPAGNDKPGAASPC